MAITYQEIYDLNVGSKYPNGKTFNNPNLIYPGQQLKMPDGSTYTVVSGDTLSKIAANYNTKLENTTTPSPQPVQNVAASVDQVRPQQTIKVERNTINKNDWRVRLSLAPGAQYLYNVANSSDILYPLKDTDGVIFPYTPTIQTSYKASYDHMDLTHSNYKLYFYKNSSVDEITMTADFTAQDATEAKYMLAVIHFLKSVTKMFYGQDVSPKAGTPPPLLYLNGFGTYQFNEHPCLLQSFTYNLPNDVDYIRAGDITLSAGVNTSDKQTDKNTKQSMGESFMSWLRKQASNLRTQGKMSQEPKWVNYATQEATYVPTKIQIQLSLLPIVTRNDISKNFSVEKYATGELLKGKTRPTGGGIW